MGSLGRGLLGRWEPCSSVLPVTPKKVRIQGDSSLSYTCTCPRDMTGGEIVRIPRNSFNKTKSLILELLPGELARGRDSFSELERGISCKDPVEYHAFICPPLCSFTIVLLAHPDWQVRMFSIEVCLLESNYLRKVNINDALIKNT